MGRSKPRSPLTKRGGQQTPVLAPKPITVTTPPGSTQSDGGSSDSSGTSGSGSSTTPDRTIERNA